MNELKQRVANAIKYAVTDKDVQYLDAELMCEIAAHEAIKAMLHPTSAMINVGCEFLDHGAFGDAYKLAIKEALK